MPEFFRQMTVLGLVLLISVPYARSERVITPEEQQRRRQIIEDQAALKLLQDQQQRSKQNDPMANVKDLLKGADDAGKSKGKSNSQGAMQTGMGALFMAAGAVMMAVAAEQANPTLETMGMMMMMQGLSQLAQGATSFGQGGASGGAQKGNQQAAEQRTGDQGAGGLNSNLAGSKPFDLDGDGTTTPDEVEKSIPLAQENLNMLANYGLKDTVLNALANGQDPRQAIIDQTGMPLPAPGDRGLMDTIAKDPKNSELIADALSKKGLPYDDVLKAIHDPNSLTNSSGSGQGLSLDQLGNPQLQAQAKEAEKKVFDQYAKYASASAAPKEEGSENTLSGSLDKKLFGLNLDGFYNKNTDLESAAFGKNRQNFLNIPGVSREVGRSLFQIMASRYRQVLDQELRVGAYIVNGELKGIAKALGYQQVIDSLKASKQSSAPTEAPVPKLNRIPALVP